MGAIMYLFGCFQGSTEALRAIQQPTHFTDFVISHSHLTVFGTFVVWAIGGLVYVWPRLCGRELWSFKMGNWSFWLITAGISTMGLVLTAGGLQQGFQWMDGVEWLDSILPMRPYWFVRTLAGRQHGHRHVAARHQPDDDGAGPAGRGRRAAPAPRRRRRCRPGERPDEMNARFVALVAGVFFFFAALIYARASCPSSSRRSRTTKVTPVVRTDLGELKWMVTDATDYTELQQRGRARLSPRGLLVLPFAVRAPGHRRDAALGPGQPRRASTPSTCRTCSRTRRIGPDLTRVGLKYSDEWHLAHFWDPRMLVAGFDHAALRGLFDAPDAARSAIVDDGAGNRTLRKDAGRPKRSSTSPASSRSRLTPNADGLLFVPERARQVAGHPARRTKSSPAKRCGSPPRPRSSRRSSPISRSSA